MGKRKGQIVHTGKAAATLHQPDGCNCPTGCMQKEPIDTDHPPAEDSVLLECTEGDKCTLNKYVHLKCYEQFETEMVRVMQSLPGHSRDFTDDQCRRVMWQRQRGYELIFKHCKCACGGFLRRSSAPQAQRSTALSTERDATKAKKKRGKGKKELPTLTTAQFNVAGSSSYARPAISSSCKGEKNDNGVQADDDSEVYIPGLQIIKQPSVTTDHHKSVKPKTAPPAKSAKIESEAPPTVIFQPIGQHCSHDIDGNVVKFIYLERYFRALAESV